MNEWTFLGNVVRRTATRLRVNGTIRPLSYMPSYGAHKDKVHLTLCMAWRRMRSSGINPCILNLDAR